MCEIKKLPCHSERLKKSAFPAAGPRLYSSVRNPHQFLHHFFLRKVPQPKCQREPEPDWYHPYSLSVPCPQKIHKVKGNSGRQKYSISHLNKHISLPTIYILLHQHAICWRGKRGIKREVNLQGRIEEDSGWQEDQGRSLISGQRMGNWVDLPLASRPMVAW